MAPPNATEFDLKEAKGGPSHRVAGIAIVAVFSSMVVVALGSIIVYYYTGWLDKPLSWIGLDRKAREKKHSIDVTTFHELKHHNNGRRISLMKGPRSMLTQVSWPKGSSQRCVHVDYNGRQNLNLPSSKPSK